jgi:hypothetical protein
MAGSTEMEDAEVIEREVIVFTALLHRLRLARDSKMVDKFQCRNLVH